MREHEKALKQGGARHLKTDMVFYHQLVSMFMMAANGEKVVDTELLTVSFKVVILLINKVKLEEAQADNEITKKKDLLLAIVKLIGVV
jgi:tRNA G46 methylase TrmB